MVTIIHPFMNIYICVLLVLTLADSTQLCYKGTLIDTGNVSDMISAVKFQTKTLAQLPE